MVDSPRKAYLKTLVRRPRIPRCPNGNMHCEDICMGASRGEDIGRYYYYCKARAGKEPCIRPPIYYFPMHSQQRQNELRALLKNFDEWVVADRLQRFTSSSMSANTTPMAVIPPQQMVADCLQRYLASSSSRSAFAASPTSGAAIPSSSSLPVPGSSLPELSPSLSAKANVKKMVKIHIYMEKNDVPIEIEGLLEHGAYSFIGDDAFCDLTEFPNAPWDVYDPYKKSFIGISTFSQQQIYGDDEFLVVRPESFIDRDCPGIHALLSHFADYMGAPSKKRKRLLNDSGWNGHGKGKRRAD